MYGRTETQWQRWPGPAPSGVPAREHVVGHPDFVEQKGERYLWCDPTEGVQWYCRRTIDRRTQKFRAEGADRADAGAILVAEYLANEAAGADAAQVSKSRTTGKRPAKRARMMSNSPEFYVDLKSEADDEFTPPEHAHLALETGTPLLEPTEVAIDLEELQLLSRELSSLKAERESFARRKRALLKREAENTGSFAESILGTLRNEFDTYCSFYLHVLIHFLN